MNPNNPKPVDSPVVFGRNETKVFVRLMYKTETRKAWLRISVGSQNRANLYNHSTVDADLPLARIKFLVEKEAERLAVYQCVLYKDRHNPQAVAKAALEALEETFDKAARARQQVEGSSATG